MDTLLQNNQLRGIILIFKLMINLLRTNLRTKTYVGIFICSFAVPVFGQGGLEAEISMGAPVADVRLEIATNFVIETAYLFQLSDKIKVGAKVGYSFLKGERTSFSTNRKPPNLNYITAAGSGLLKVVDRLWLGADAGYAFGISSINQTRPFEFSSGVQDTNGFYLCPRIRYQFADRVALQAAYRYIYIGGLEVTTITAGLNIFLFK